MASSEKEEKKVDLEEKVSEEKNTEKVEEIKKDTNKKTIAPKT